MTEPLRPPFRSLLPRSLEAEDEFIGIDRALPIRDDSFWPPSTLTHTSRMLFYFGQIGKEDPQWRPGRNTVKPRFTVQTTQGTPSGPNEIWSRNPWSSSMRSKSLETASFHRFYQPSIWNLHTWMLEQSQPNRTNPTSSRLR